MKVTVIIPCRNEKNHIQACVDAIYTNTLVQQNEVEVLVLDGLSDDGTPGIILELKKQYPTLRLLENPEQVTPVAFNLGIKQAKGDFIQIIGARQLISTDYLEKAVKRMEENPDIWCIGGRVENVFENQVSHIIANAMSSPFGVGGGNFRTATESTFVDTVGTPMYPKWVFDKVGLFDEELVRNQDDEFNYRVTQAGGKIFLDADILIRYFVRADYQKLHKQYLQYGYWKVYVNRKHGSITTLRQLFPAALVLFAVLGLVASFFSVYLLLAYVSIMGLYGLLALFFAQKVKVEGSPIWAIARTFFILHFSYGRGYLKGIWHFLILRRNPSAKQTTLSR